MIDSSTTGTLASGNINISGTNAPWSRPRPGLSRQGLKPAPLKARWRRDAEETPGRWEGWARPRKAVEVGGGWHACVSAAQGALIR